MKQGYTKAEFDNKQKHWRIENFGPHRNNPSVDYIEVQWSEIGEVVAEMVYSKEDAQLICAAPLMFEVLKKLDAEGGHGLDNHKMIREALVVAYGIEPI